MGTQYYVVDFQNVSDHTCQMRGYPGVSAYADGHQIGSSATWDGPIGVGTVTLQPGAAAQSVLGIQNADNYPAGVCGKVTATALKVYPPNQTVPVYVAYRFSACSVTGTHQLVVWPVEAVLGNPQPVHPTKQLIVPFGTANRMTAVVVTVPRTWQLAKTQPQSCCQTPPTRCIVEAGSDYAGNIGNCRLTVTYAPTPDSKISPNVPALSGLSGGQRWSTAQESNATTAGRPGEYRRFVNRSTAAQFEQWTVMTSPQVAFFHQITSQSGHALVAGIVGSAVLPPQTDSRRPVDVGYVRQVSRQADGYHLRLDRVVPNMDGTIINRNPATYDYRLNGLLSVPGLDRCDRWGDLSCSMAWLLGQFAKGPHPADGSFPVAGAYVLVDQEAGGYHVQFLGLHDQT